MEENKHEVLIQAVKRYVESEDYPSVKTICAILAVEKKAKEDADGTDTI